MSNYITGGVGMFGNNIDVMVEQIKSDAANVPSGQNPAYAASNFLEIFPQFGLTKPVSGTPPTTAPVIPDVVMTLYLEMANASLQYSRWRSKWAYAMALYMAHFCTLWLQTQIGGNLTAASVVAAAEARFSVASESAGDVSASYDTSSIAGDLPGWAAWKSTTYGLQLATLAKGIPTANAGMYVW